jgi:hypothetical protein
MLVENEKPSSSPPVPDGTECGLPGIVQGIADRRFALSAMTGAFILNLDGYAVYRAPF